MAVVNRVPRGLLGLLDAKTQGQTPKDTLPDLQPSIDLTDNYVADLPLQAEQGTAITSSVATTQAVVEVPAGQLWYVFCVTTQSVSTGANRDGIAVPVLRSPVSGGLQIPLETVYFTPQTLALGESHVVSRVFGKPWLVGPGTEFGSVILHTNGQLSLTTSVVFRSVSV